MTKHVFICLFILSYLKVVWSWLCPAILLFHGLGHQWCLVLCFIIDLVRFPCPVLAFCCCPSKLHFILLCLLHVFFCLPLLYYFIRWVSNWLSSCVCLLILSSECMIFYKLTFGFFTGPALHPFHYLCVQYREIMTFWKSCIALLFHVSPLCCNVHICWLKVSLWFYLEIWVSSYVWNAQCPVPLGRRK